jgi:hypothetical protein
MKQHSINLVITLIRAKMNDLQQKPQSNIGAVMLSAIELMTDEQLKEEQRVLTAEIEAAEHRLNRVENEIFYRANPECRRH